ncbi:PH domain-containing protein [Botrytis cinerea]
MGNVSSRPDDGAPLFREKEGTDYDTLLVTISSLSITNQRRKTLLNIVPNGFPATRVSAIRDLGDSAVVEYVQDPDTLPGAAPNFLIKINNEEELTFNFTFIIRQSQGFLPATNGAKRCGRIDRFSYKWTYICIGLDGARSRESSHSRISRRSEFAQECQRTIGWGLFYWRQSISVVRMVLEMEASKANRRSRGGWRNNCSFLEYDQRAHRLNTLASFSFWVFSTIEYARLAISPFHLVPPPKLRLPSSQSLDSRVSGQELSYEDAPPSPNPLSLDLVVPQSQMADVPKVDVSCQRPGEDMSATEDGPLFRATMKALEQKTGNMRTRMKKVLRKAEAAQIAQMQCNDAIGGFMEALREASNSNANAVQPALDHYFDKIAREILQYEKQNALNLEKVIIEPLAKLYTLDIKQAESKKRDFEEESKDYYAYVSRYLGQRQDSLKQKKRVESDTKYQTKRRNFELKRFDYSSFMQDLHGGRKEQEVLSHLTKYADAQTRSYLAAAKKVEQMLPQLEALSAEVQDADKEFQYQRTEREEKRRNLEKSTITYVEPETVPAVPVEPVVPGTSSSGNGAYTSDSELNRADSTGHQLRPVATNSTIATVTNGGMTEFSRSPGSLSSTVGGQLGSPAQILGFVAYVTSKKKITVKSRRGLLWALSRPGSHVDPRGLNKQAWHKFWIVLDAGKLSEYSNWKQRLDLHMEPIDLRMASRVYQATSEDDMKNWISAINNALQSAVEGRGMKDYPALAPQPEPHSIRRDIGSILTGKSSSMNHGHSSNHSNTSNTNNVFRRTTVGARPAYGRSNSSSFDESPDKLLQLLRETDQGNCWCADCGSGIKTEWVSINLAIILCIECSGIHRSLGTHISKVRSLTLDINSFTTDIVELLLLVGNRVSNMVWEARLDLATKPAPQATREQRLKFITAKYVDRAFVEPISSTLSRYATADETLLAAVKKNDVQQVIYALALKANPNVTDKSRGTHSVFLALAAADPASPAQVTSSTRVEPPAKIIPTSLPAFPLSRSATLYIEQKTQRAGGTSDTLGALPTTMTPQEKLKEREARLQKRVSAGGRLAKTPIQERS